MQVSSPAGLMKVSAIMGSTDKAELLLTSVASLRLYTRDPKNFQLHWQGILLDSHHFC